MDDMVSVATGNTLVNALGAQLKCLLTADGYYSRMVN